MRIEKTHMSEKDILLRAEGSKIMIAAMTLDDEDGVDVYLALHGNTGCICVQVTENKSLAYENRCFRTNVEQMVEIRRDLEKMLTEKRRERDERNE
ncbi:MAG: hypothetical protein ACI4L2_05840 [Wujia sp.]